MLDEYKKLLQEYVKNRSISTDSTFQNGIEATVDWLKNHFEKDGYKVTVVRGYDNPIVVAEYIADSSYKTCLIYGHYDVQPADKSEGWTSEPFELVEREGRVYARGAMDNKGQNLIHILAISELIKNKKLGYNVKFMIEGNEETGSPSLDKFVRENKELLKADFTMISDGELTSGKPALELGFRGGFNLTLTVRTSNVDLHSGIFGGAAPSASHELSKFLATLYTNDNRVNIAGFYNDVVEPEEDIRNFSKNIPFDLDEYARISGNRKLLTEEGYDFYSQTGLRPTVQVTGIKTGYTGQGYRNSIPAEATAKINFRLVNNQDPEKILALFKEHAKNVFPDYVEYEIENSDPYYGIRLKSNSEYIQRAKDKIRESYEEAPVFKYCGGGLPIVTLFSEELGIPNVIVPFANEDGRMHATDENFNLEYVKKALDFSTKFFEK